MRRHNQLRITNYELRNINIDITLFLPRLLGEGWGEVYKNYELRFYTNKYKS